MFRWLHRLLEQKTPRRTRCTVRTRLEVERLEDRWTPADISFGFAVAKFGQQVLIDVQDVDQAVSGNWTVTYPTPTFVSVVSDTFAQGVVAFGIRQGTREVYKALFDVNGNLTQPWFRVAPGVFDKLVVGTVGFSQNPILFGVGTPEVGRRVFACTFTASGNLRQGWSLVAPGQFESLAMANFGAGAQVALFGVGVNHHAYEARFDANGIFIDGWISFAPGNFQSLAAAGRVNTSLQLVGVGLDGQAYAANFGSNGLLANGWFPVNSGQPSAFTQVVAGSIGNGNTMAFALGANSQAYYAQFGVQTGDRIGPWTVADVNLRQFSQLAVGEQSGRAKLYALGKFDFQVYFEVFDSNAQIDVPMTATPSGMFTYVDVAP